MKGASSSRLLPRTLCKKLQPCSGVYTSRHKSETVTVSRRHHLFPREVEFAKRHPDLGSASDWLKQISFAAQPIRSSTHMWLEHVIRMDFLRSFLRHHFELKPLVASLNVGCLLRVSQTE